MNLRVRSVTCESDMVMDVDGVESDHEYRFTGFNQASRFIVVAACGQ